jgi:hypothetical protein
MGVGKDLLEETGIDVAAEAITREALIRELANSTETDFNEEGELEMHASLTIWSQELTVFLGYNNTKLIMDLTDWYDCRDRWTYRTKNMGTDDITGVWVNLIGATTPDLIRSSLPIDAVGGGLASRMIFVYEHDKEKSVAAPFLSEEQKGLKDDLLHDLDKMHMMRGKFVVTENMLERYVDWYQYQDNHEAISAPEFQGYNQRRPNHVLKLSIVLSAARREDRKITLEIFEDALNLLKRTEKKMPRTFAGYGESRSSEVMSQIMQYIADEGQTSKSDIMSRYYADIEDERHLGNILESLRVMGFIDYGVSNGTVKYNEDNSFSAQYN